MDYDKLADRCERAKEPDRKLDVAIFHGIGAPVPFQFFSKVVALTYDETEQCYFAPIGDMRVRYEPPEFTASIDAAVTLVPENMQWSVGTFGKSIATAQVFNRCRSAATPALALCAAALRAR